MPDTFTNRIKHAWNAFWDKDSSSVGYGAIGSSYSYRPDRLRLSSGSERSIMASVYTRIGIDASTNLLRHARVDQNGRFLELIDSGLNECLSVEANVDQTGRAFVQDVVMSMCDEGSVAIVPVDTTVNPKITGSFDIQSMRTGKILEWFPQHVRVEVYNDRRGEKEILILPKKTVAIVENPLYSVMNEINSTLQRLILKLNLLDAIDNQSGSGKLDLIIQLPYVVKSEARRVQAEARRKDIEDQLAGSKYGIAYTDGTEKVTQLNRPAENNLMAQIEYLSRMLYGQLGITEAVFDGSADEKETLNYYSRTIDPILNAITDSMVRRFLTKTARTQGQSIVHFKDAFRLTATADLATVADSFTRNAILSSNEVRALIGYRPSEDPEADALRNKNLNPTKGPGEVSTSSNSTKPKEQLNG